MVRQVLNVSSCSVGVSESSAEREEMSDRDVNLTQCGTRNGKDTFGLDERSRDISCDHGMPCEKPTQHSLAPEAMSPLAMVRSDKAHVVGTILSCVDLRNPFSNVRLFRHTTVRHDLFLFSTS